MTIRLVDVYTEAFERCGINPSALTSEHLQSARRTMELEATDQTSAFSNLFTLVDFTQTLSTGTSSFVMPVNMLDIQHAVLRDPTSNQDTPINITGYQGWLDITKKTMSGRPDTIYVNRELTTDRTQTVNIWMVPDRAYTLVGKYLKYMDLDNSWGDKPGVPQYWEQAITSVLARGLALKFAPERYELLLADEVRALRNARRPGSENAPIQFTLGSRRGASRGHRR